jgi:tRNA A37 threonylcarbamoyladenosine dehydratase
MNRAEPLPPGADLERRFGGLRRLYGAPGYERIRAARVAVVGLGGVGSWAVEALARSGVAQLVLIDLDHVAESNLNRQVQALESTIGRHKGAALAERIVQIHPQCDVRVVDEFVDDKNWPALLPCEVDAVIDACDQVRAKTAIAAWALASGNALVCTGAAGGKQRAQAVETGDLAAVTHDPLLASLRQRLRKQHGAPRSGPIGIDCVYSCENVARPQVCDIDDAAIFSDGSLNCSGYGSSVAVTATFGLVAAGEVLRRRAAGGAKGPI